MGDKTLFHNGKLVSLVEKNTPYGRKSYGRIEDIDVKLPREARGTAYAFVQFRDARDADDAVRARDGYRFDDGHRLRVEHSRGGRDRESSRGGDRDRDSGSVRRPNGKYRIVITGLPDSASWQDLKDFLRPVGKSVCYVDVKAGRGTAAFEHEDEMKDVIHELDGKKFSNRFDEGYVKIKEEGASSSARSRSRSRSRDRRSKSRDRSGSRDGDRKAPVKSRSASADRRSKSPVAARDHSRSRSRSRSPVAAKDKSRSASRD